MLSAQRLIQKIFVSILCMLRLHQLCVDGEDYTQLNIKCAERKIQSWKSCIKCLRKFRCSWYSSFNRELREMGDLGHFFIVFISNSTATPVVNEPAIKLFITMTASNFVHFLQPKCSLNHCQMNMLFFAALLHGECVLSYRLFNRLPWMCNVKLSLSQSINFDFRK